MALVEMLTFSSLESKTPAAVGLMLKLSSVGAEREMTGLTSAASSWVGVISSVRAEDRSEDREDSEAEDEEEREEGKISGRSKADDGAVS